MAIVQPIGTGTIDRVNAGGGGMVVLIAMIILFGAATYFTGRQYGNARGVTVVAGFVLFSVGLIWLVG